MTQKTANPLTLRISFLSSILLMLSIAAGYFLLEVTSNASRSIGWILFSGCIAFMLYPGVNILDRYVNRGLAVGIMALFTLLIIVVPIYSVVDDVNSQTSKLERTLPARAKELEEEGRFATSFKEFRLEEKTRSALKSIPDYIQGGNANERLKANADRTIAFIASSVLMLFFLTFGKRLISGALSIIPDEDKRKVLKSKLANAYQRATAFAWAQVGLSISTGLFAYAICRAYSIPGGGLLATWVAFWNIIPIFGTVIGSLPIIILTGAQSVKDASIIFILVVLYEIIESLVRHKYLGTHTMRLDSIVSIVVFFAGLEMYGLGGALTGLLIVSFLHAFAAEYSDIKIIKTKRKTRAKKATVV